MSRYWKLIVYVLTAVVGGVSVDLFDWHGLSGAEWANIAVAAITAASVWFTRNSPTQPWAKTVVAVIGAGVTVLTSAWSDSRLDTTEIQQIILAVLGALAVGTVANVPPGSQPEAAIADGTDVRDVDYPYGPGAVE